MTVTLKSSDGEFFEVDELVVNQMLTVKNLTEDTQDEGNHFLPNVTGKTLSKIIDYCSHHTAVEGQTISEAEIQMFDADVVRVDQATLFDLLTGASYLNVRNLVELLCEAVADAIKDKNPEEIRTCFNIEDDLSVER